MKELKARVEDALHATKAAVEEGIVPVAERPLRTQKAVDKLMKTLEGDVRSGAAIIRRTLEEPVRMIANNAGLDGAVIVETVRNQDEFAVGFNADEEKIQNLVAAGVIDPTKVVRVALQNAASIPGLLLTTEACLGSDRKSGNPCRPWVVMATVAGTEATSTRRLRKKRAATTAGLLPRVIHLTFDLTAISDPHHQHSTEHRKQEKIPKRKTRTFRWSGKFLQILFRKRSRMAAGASGVPFSCNSVF
jgi:hypothetical protein